MNEYERQFHYFLHERGLRLTLQRRTIVKAAFAKQGHFEAEQLTSEIATSGGNASRATVYRTLSLMAEAGLLREIAMPEEKRHYEHVYGHPRHDHMICTSCGRVIEFRDTFVEERAAVLASQAHFDLTEYRFRLLGRCARCSR